MPAKKTMAGTTAKNAKPTASKAKPAKETPKPKKNDKALVKAQTKEVSASVEELIGQSAGSGAEMFGVQDIKRPQIKLMQSNSPQINKRNERYVEGAENGDILVAGPNHVYSDSIRIIVIGFARNYVEWKSRDDGGGLIGAHPFAPSVVQGMNRGKGGTFITEDGNEMRDTMSYFVLYENPDGEWEPAMLFLSSTMLSCGREINTRINNRSINTSKGTRKAPTYANVITLEVVSASNDQGDWNKFKVADVEFIDDAELFVKASNEYKAFSKNADIDFSASADHVTEVPTEEEEEESEGHY